MSHLIYYLKLVPMGTNTKRAIESRTLLPSLGDNFLVNNNADAKSDIRSLESTYYVYVWKVWCKSGQFFC
jgi:hypothetical protein